MPAKQAFRWDWTLFTTEEAWEETFKTILIPSLKEIAKKWCFQLEKAPTTGSLHFQGRMSLSGSHAMTKSKLWNTLKEMKWNIATDALSPTHDKGFSYVMKQDTRVQGPWSDKDFIDLPPCVKLPKGKTWYPWQQTVYERVKAYAKQTFEDTANMDTRHINVVVDRRGGAGKTILFKRLCVEKLALPLLLNTDAEKFNAWACSLVEQHGDDIHCFVLNVPRSIPLSETETKKCFGSLESIKDGVLMDQRYKASFTIKKVDPIVWIFMNDFPKKDWMSWDRWKLWMVDYTTNDLIEGHWPKHVAQTE